jgi:glucose/arabinose dehydrogenase
MLRHLSALVPAAALAVAGLLPSPTVVVAAGAAPILVARVVQSGLVNPWDVAFLPGGQMLVTERPGRLRVYASGSPGAALLRTSTVSGVHAEGEAGLMGLAVDPAFGTNRRLYVCASRDDGGAWRNQILRYRLGADWRITFEAYVVRNGAAANTIHDGCALQFGPDGKLWATIGDAGNASRAQVRTSLNGKVLRMNRDGTAPSDNPILPGARYRSIVYSMGHRNPQGIAFQPGTGRAYAVEHGPDRDDEINWIRPGRNYGWPCYTGFNHPYQTTGCGPASSYTQPAWASGAPTLATSGATFVAGASWGAWAGSFFVSTLKEQDLRRFQPDTAGTAFAPRSTLYNGIWGRLRACVLGPSARLYLTSSNGSNDKIIRIVASQP